jgi:hypothetical protein
LWVISSRKANFSPSKTKEKIYPMKKSIFITLILSSCTAIVLSQQIKFNVIPGELKYSDQNRFAGDTVFIKLELIANRTYYLSFKNKVAVGVQGYLFDSYLGFTYPINPNEDYHEFQTYEEPLSTSQNRFYLRLVKCF